MFGQVLQSTLREMQSTFGSARPWLVMVLVGIALGVAGPFDTFDAMPLAPRVVYWTLMVVITYLGGSFASDFAKHFFNAKNASESIVLVARVIAPLFPVIPLVFTFNALALSVNPFSGPAVWGLVLYVGAIGLVVSLLGILVSGAPSNPADVPSSKSDQDVSTQRPSILERVELAKRGELISLSVQDHYVEISTQNGQSLVLMRLSDAMKETGRAEGLQIHRSHWVALAAVRNVAKRDGKTLVQLSNGKELPVSRTFLSAVKAAGLMTR